MAFKGTYVTIDFIKEQANDILEFGNILNDYKIAELVYNLLSRLNDPSILVSRVTDGKNGPPPIEVINYTGLLPFGIVNIIEGSIRDYESKVKMIPTENPYFLADRYESDEYDDTELDDNFDFPTRISENRVAPQHKYLIQNGEIQTSMKEGFIEMAFKGFPLDSKGFPKVPEMEKLVEMLKWAILERAAMKLWAKGKLSERVYNKMYQQYVIHKRAASTQLKLNSLPDMEKMANRFMRLVPDTNQYENNFIDFGYPEEYIKHSW